MSLLNSEAPGRVPAGTDLLVKVDEVAFALPDSLSVEEGPGAVIIVMEGHCDEKMVEIAGEGCGKDGWPTRPGGGAMLVPVDLDQPLGNRLVIDGSLGKPVHEVTGSG